MKAVVLHITTEGNKPHMWHMRYMEAAAVPDSQCHLPIIAAVTGWTSQAAGVYSFPLWRNLRVHFAVPSRNIVKLLKKCRQHSVNGYLCERCLS